MKCPFCRATTTDVYNTRSTKFATQIWRRRRCGSCHEAFTTYETPDLGFLRVAKKHGKPEPYSRAKLYSSIYSAFPAHPHKQSTIDAITDTIESKVLDLQTPTVQTSQIARITLSALKHFNTAAFVRYLTSQTDLISDAQLKKELKKY